MVPLAFRLCITRPDFPVSGAEHSAHPRAMYSPPLWRRVKHFRRDLRHLSLRPDTYHDFSRKCWRCHHAQPISQGSGLPGNRLPYLKSPSRFCHMHCPFWNTAGVVQGKRLMSLMIAQPVKSVYENRHKHNHRWSIEGRASCVTLFISYVWEGVEPCRFSTISEQRQGCFLGCWCALQLVKIRRWKI